MLLSLSDIPCIQTILFVLHKLETSPFGKEHIKAQIKRSNSLVKGICHKFCPQQEIKNNMKFFFCQYIFHKIVDASTNCNPPL